MMDPGTVRKRRTRKSLRMNVSDTENLCILMIKHKILVTVKWFRNPKSPQFRSGKVEKNVYLQKIIPDIASGIITDQ